MKNKINLFCVFVVIFLASCSSTSKVQSSGELDLQRQEHSKKLAPLIVQYKLTPPGANHELYFFDQDKNRIIIVLNGKTETTQGVAIYFPADRLYALSGVAIVKGKERTVYSFGTNLNLFRVKSGMVNVLPFFEVTAGLNGTLSAQQSRQSHINDAKQKFTNMSPINAIEVQLLEN